MHRADGLRDEARSGLHRTENRQRRLVAGKGSSELALSLKYRLKTMVVMSPAARIRWAQGGGKRLEGCLQLVVAALLQRRGVRLEHRRESPWRSGAETSVELAGYCRFKPDTLSLQIGSPLALG